MSNSPVTLLEVWTLSPPLSGGQVVSGAGKADLFHVQFLIDPVAAVDPGQIAEVTARYAPISAGKEGPFQPLDPSPEAGDGGASWIHSAVAQDVVAFRFSSESGWSSLIDLEGVCMPQRCSVMPQEAPFGPFCDDISLGGSFAIRSYDRLYRVAGWPGSFVRLVAVAGRPFGFNQKADETNRWWVLFRFPFRVPLLGNAQGMLPAREGGLIDSRLAAAFYSPSSSGGASFLDLQFPAGGDPQSVGRPGDVGEVQSAAPLRCPYFAGSFTAVTMRHVAGAAEQQKLDLRFNPCQSFALNSAGLAVQYGLASRAAAKPSFDDRTAIDPSFFNVQQQYYPDRQDRLANAARLGDGIWWSKNHFDGDPSTELNNANGDYIDALPELTVGFANLPALLDGTLTPTSPFPNYPDPENGGDPVGFPYFPIVTAITPVATPAAEPQPPIQAGLALLDLFGLESAKVAAPSLAAMFPLQKIAKGAKPVNETDSLPPYHYLHAKLVQQGGAPTSNFSFEWRRCVLLEVPGDVAMPATIPVLLRVRQHSFDPTSSAGRFSAGHVVTIEGLTDSHVLDIWTRFVAGSCRAAVARRFGTSLVSAMPDLLGDGSAARRDWVLELECGESFPTAVYLGPEQCQLPLSSRFIKSGKLYRGHDFATVRDWFQALPPPSVGPTRNAQVSAAAAIFQGLKDHLGKPIKERAYSVQFLSAASSPAPLSFKTDRNGQFRFDPHRVTIQTVRGTTDGKPRSGAAQTVAVGALDLEFAPPPASSPGAPPPDSLVEIDLTIPADPGQYVAITAPANGLRLTCALPGGGDDQDRDKSVQSLIWSSEPIFNGTQFEFTDVPDLSAGGRRVDFTIRALSDASLNGAPQPVVVLDPEPMSVLRITMAAGTARAEDDVLATWDSVEKLWRMPSNSSAAGSLEFPPQAIAEAWARAKDETGYLPQDQVTEGSRVRAQLTAPTRLEIKLQRTAENSIAGWDLRHLLADPTVQTPGVGVTKIGRFEALYGLEAFETPTPGTWLAELAGWRGLPRDPIVVKSLTLNSDRQQLWTSAYNAMQRRPGVFELRDQSATEAQAFIEAVQFRLRQQGKYGYSTKGLDKSRFADWFGNDDIVGSALSGFEDLGLIEDLLGQALKGTGTIKGMQLSAHGAWTQIHAEFSGGLMQIIAYVENGRLEEAQFIRLGRVGIFRTKARHVIVYRRTFLPSAQFHASQNDNYGRPIVRKVEEYIQILEDVRNFPDQGNGTATNPGPVTGIRFRTVKLYVDGSWRYPVTTCGLRDSQGNLPDKPYHDIGYAIPLWREGVDPLVYPRPDIEFQMAGGAAGALRRIANPADMRFYTLFTYNNQAAASDTDLWPNVNGFDYGDRLTDSPLNGQRRVDLSKFRTGGTAQKKRASTNQVATGLEPFTFRLEPGALVDMMAGRNPTKPMLADLATVTLMRAAPIDAGKSVGAKKDFFDFADGLEAARDEARGELADLLGQLKSPGGLSVTAMAAKAQDLLKGSGSVGSLATRIGTYKDGSGKPTELASAAVSGGWATDQKAKITGAMNYAQANLIELWQTKVGNAIAAVNNTGYAAWVPLSAEFLSDLTDDSGNLASIAAPGSTAQSVATKALQGVLDSLTAYDVQLKAGIDSGAGQLASAIGSVVAGFDSWCTSAAKNASDALGKINPADLDLTGANNAAAALRSLSNNLGNLATLVDSAGSAATDSLQSISVIVGAMAPGAAMGLRSATEQIQSTASQAHTQLSAGQAQVAGLAGSVEQAAGLCQSAADAARAAAVAALQNALTGVVTALTKGAGGYGDATLQGLSTAVALLKSQIDQVVGDLTAKIEAEIGAIGSSGTGILGQIMTFQLSPADTGWPTVLGMLINNINAGRASLAAAMDTAGVSTALGGLKSAFDAIATGLAATAAGDPVTGLMNIAASYIARTAAGIVGQAGSIAAWLGDASQPLADLRTAVDKAADIKTLTDLLSDIPSSLDAAAGLLSSAVQNYADQALSGTAYLAGQDALSILRAAGAPPVVDGLAFNTDGIAYHFPGIDGDPRVITTPMTALLEQSGNELRGIGVAMPVLGIDGSLLAPVSAALSGLDASNVALNDIKQALSVDQILADFAGLKSLMGGLDMSDKLADAVKISQNLDPSIGTPYAEATISFKPGDHDLFSFSAFALTVQNPSFQGTLKASLGASGSVTKSVNASLTADWVLNLGGAPLVEIDDTEAVYDASSGLSYKIDPKNIKFNGALQFVSQLLEAWNDDSPVKLEMLTEDGRTVGVKSTFDMPPTTVGAGAFTLMNASMGVHFELAARSEFEITVYAYLGKASDPFTMQITWLGGGGYLEAQSTYRPQSKTIDIAVVVSMGASAGLGFSFGPLEGAVQVYFGIEASYISSSGSGRMMIAGVIVIDGSVSAWGLVTVDLDVMLSLSYDGSSSPVGRGHIDVEVQISRFFSLSFSSDYTTTL